MQNHATAYTQADHLCLPDGYQRSDVIRLLSIIAPKVGLTPAPLRTLIMMIGTVPPAHWTDPSKATICYQSQRKIATSSQLTARSIRNHEAALEALGLIEKTVAANGSRGSFASGHVVQGISFAPLIRRFRDLQALEEATTQAVRDVEILIRKCSAARRMVNRLMDQIISIAPKCPVLAEVTQLKAVWPRRYEGLARSALSDLLIEVNQVVESLQEVLQNLDRSSGQAEETFRPHIHATMDTPIESCSASHALDRTARKRADDSLSESAPNVADCHEEKKAVISERGFKPKWDETFPTSTLYRIASEDFQMYLDAEKRPGQPLTPHQIIQAAHAYFPELRIATAVWDEAVSTMGDTAAALSLLAIDANRFHPVTPIHSPGATLRTYTRLAAAGRLNLHGSLIGLAQRQKTADR